jgi:hypothetical protein
MADDAATLRDGAVPARVAGSVARVSAAAAMAAAVAAVGKGARARRRGGERTEHNERSDDEVTERFHEVSSWWGRDDFP